MFSVGTALAPVISSFFVFRALTAFCGTTFLVLGASAIGDIYRPVRVCLDPSRGSIEWLIYDRLSEPLRLACFSAGQLSDPPLDPS